MSTTRPRPEWALLLVGAVTALGLALRLPSLGDSLAGDEVGTYFEISHGLGEIMDLVRSELEGTPPLYFLLAWTTKGIGTPEESLRLVPLLAGTATIPVTYLLGVRTVGRSAAAVGSALVALSPFLIVHATDGRAYALVLLLTALSTLCMVIALETGRTRWWVAYAACSCAAMYTHYVAVFVLLAQLAWALLARPGARRALLVANVGAAVAYLPWLPGFLDDTGGPQSMIIEQIRPFSFQVFKSDVGHWGFGHPGTPVGVVPGDLGVRMIAAGLGASLIALALRARRDWRDGTWRPSSGLVLVVVLALATPVGAALYSLVADSIYLPRNLICSWPGFALLLGAALTGGRGWLRVPAVALVLGGFAIGAAKTLEAGNRKPDYEAAAEFIERTGARGDPVVDVPGPSPGPQTPLEAALSPDWELVPEDFEVLALGEAPLPVRLRQYEPGPPGLFAPVEAPEGEAIARRAASLGRDGRIFLLAQGHASIEQLRASLYPPLAGFLGALPERFRLVEVQRFPGYGFSPFSVYVLEDSGAGAASGTAAGAQ